MLWKILVVSGLLAGIHGYPYGAPVDLFPRLCQTMDPSGFVGGHNVTKQTTTAPYDILLTNSDKCCTKDQKVTVTIKSQKTEEEGGYFEGLFIQGRVKGKDEITGTFAVTDPELKTVKCGHDNSAATHSEEHHYLEKKFTWTPKADFEGDVEFVATIAKNTRTYWLNVKSTTLAVKPMASGAAILQTTLVFTVLSVVLATLIQ
jgi:hypothetical protein